MVKDEDGFLSLGEPQINDRFVGIAERKANRRDLLKTLGGLAGAALLGACAPQGTLQPLGLTQSVDTQVSPTRTETAPDVAVPTAIRTPAPTQSRPEIVNTPAIELTQVPGALVEVAGSPERNLEGGQPFKMTQELRKRLNEQGFAPVYRVADGAAAVNVDTEFGMVAYTMVPDQLVVGGSRDSTQEQGNGVAVYTFEGSKTLQILGTVPVENYSRALQCVTAVVRDNIAVGSYVLNRGTVVAVMIDAIGQVAGVMPTAYEANNDMGLVDIGEEGGMEFQVNQTTIAVTQTGDRRLTPELTWTGRPAPLGILVPEAPFYDIYRHVIASGSVLKKYQQQITIGERSINAYMVDVVWGLDANGEQIVGSYFLGGDGDHVGETDMVGSALPYDPQPATGTSSKTTEVDAKDFYAKLELGLQYAFDVYTYHDASKAPANCADDPDCVFSVNSSPLVPYNKDIFDSLAKQQHPVASGFGWLYSILLPAATR